MWYVKKGGLYVRRAEGRKGSAGATKEQRKWARNENAGQWTTSQRHAARAPPAYWRDLARAWACHHRDKGNELLLNF